MAVQRFPIAGPFKGIISDLPPTVVPNGWDDSLNFIGWKGRQRIRPGLNLANQFSPADGTPALNMTSFQDVENFLHTIILTANNAYYMTAGFVLHPMTFPTGYILTVVIDAPGTGYLQDDIIDIMQGGSFGGSAQVTSVGGSGDITRLDLLGSGYGYTAATGLATTGGTGTGATVTITVSSFSSLMGTGLPYAVVKANNRVYFCNGSVPLCYIDGEINFKVAGNVPGACRFLTANQNHLIGAAWSEPDPTQVGSIFFPNRVRWSDSGNYDQWDESLDTSTAGVADLVSTPDVITGLSTLGTYSYVYRTNGISIMQPTGQAAIPFYIPNYSVSPKGEGCVFPYSLSTYNNVDRFVGNYDVWSFDGTNFIPLMDGKCNKQFFADLQGASGTVRGFTTPVLDNGFQFLGYVITIPGINVSWILNIAEQSWSRMNWLAAPGTTTGWYDLQFIEQVYLT